MAAVVNEFPDAITVNFNVFSKSAARISKRR